MLTSPLDVVSLPILFSLFIALLFLALDGGYRLGQWRRERIKDENEQAVGGMVTSILGLVALVLGFTFSLAASRFDARRMAILEEANAIGTTHLRARLLPEPERSQVERLLQDYVEIRIHATEQGNERAAMTRSEQMHAELWNAAVAAAARDSGSHTTVIFIQSLNEVIDVHAKRVLVGMRSRVPVFVWLGLFGLSLVGMAAVGYLVGLSGSRRSPLMFALVLTFSIVLLLIADLDRGQEGLLRVSQQALVDLQTSIQSPSSSGNALLTP